MEAERLKAEAEGISNHGRVEHSCAFRNQSDGGSSSHLVKCNRIKKKHTSTNQSDGGSPSHLVKRSSIKKKHVSSNAAQQNTKGCSRRCRDLKRRLFGYVNKSHLKLAETALQFYGNNQGAEFEIVQVLHYGSDSLIPPEPDIKKSTIWIHVAFTAKSKNVNSSDASPKHFFGEIFKDYFTGKFHVTFCDTFEPSDDPGFDHGCVFCSPDQKFHPADGYTAGRPLRELGGVIWKCYTVALLEDRKYSTLAPFGGFAVIAAWGSFFCEDRNC